MTWFRNDIDNFVVRNPTGEIEEDLPVIEFVGADSVLQGFEAHTDIEATESLTVEAGLDYVRGTLQTTDEPLPRIPPFRFTGGVRYRWNALQMGGQVVATADQDRVFSAETPTDGYGLLKLFGVYPSSTDGPRIPSRLASTTSRTRPITTISRSSRTSCPRWAAASSSVYGIRF